MSREGFHRDSSVSSESSELPDSPDSPNSNESNESNELRDARRADAAARECVQRVFDRPLVLEAGAGTGKTSALVARIVSWCMGPGWDLACARAAAGDRVGPGQRAEPLTLPPSADPRDPRDMTSLETIAAGVLSRVAAITFTEAAAAEMAERTGEAFAAVARGELRPGLLESALPDDRLERSDRARALLGALDHLVVRTIHAWCRGLLARHPLEAGLHPNFAVDADMRLQAEVVREVVEESVRVAYATQDSPLLQLALEGRGAREVEETLAALVAEGVVPAALRADPFTPERVERHVVGLRAALAALTDCDGGRLAGVSRRSKKTHAALSALDRTRIMVEEWKADGVDPLQALETLCQSVAETWQGALLSRIADWSKGRLTASEAEALGDRAAEFSDLAAGLLPWLRALSGLSPRRCEAGRSALVPMLERVYAQLRARGIATFASLLSAASDLLEAHPQLCRRVRLDLDQLLVDEFQDTDALQCSIVRHLALSGPESERPGLFLVGDPKQSIYGWRSADLAAYDGFVREVEDAGGEVHSLTVNFRSVPAILDEVERAIAPVMLRSPGLQPRFQRLDVSPSLIGDEGYRRGGRAPVEYWVIRGRDPEPSGADDDAGVATSLGSAQATRLEAEALAADLFELHETEGVPWREMALLFRGMGDLDEYLAALRQRGVPYAVERDRNYYRRREVIDAAAFVRCVLDPNDHLALVTTLRSPAVGVPDAALIPLWSRGFPALLADLYGADTEVHATLAEVTQEVVDLLAGPPAKTQACDGEIEGPLPSDPAEPVDGFAEIPGLDRVRGWELSLLAMIETLGLLRQSFDRDAADVFVERLQTLSLLEVSEAARYLGAFRLANLGRFFRDLRAELVSGCDPQAILRRLRGDIASGRDDEEQGPVGESNDAVPVMTIHRAKGLDFEHVYLVQLHKRSRSDQLPTTAVAENDGVLEFRFFSQATLGFEGCRALARRVESAERVRTLYVAMTRAKRRLVLMGNFQGSREPVPGERAMSHAELLSGRVARESPDAVAGLDLAEMMRACAAAGDKFRDADGVRWVFPALASQERSRSSSLPADSREPVALPAADQIARERRLIAALQKVAAARMRLRFGGPASGDAHALLEDARPVSGPVSEEDGPARARSHGGASARATSIAAGVAIHRVLEDLNLESDPQPELARQRARLQGLVCAAGSAEEFDGGSGVAGPALWDAALERAYALLDRFAAGFLARRLWEIGPHIVARELEVWLPGSAGAPEGEGLAAPVRYIAGAIDLVYRDPSDGEWVVADYKTDRVASRRERDEPADCDKPDSQRPRAGSTDLESRAASYTSQGAVYTRAVQQALGLDRLPRFELWFLDADVVVAPGGASAGRSPAP